MYSVSDIIYELRNVLFFLVVCDAYCFTIHPYKKETAGRGVDKSRPVTSGNKQLPCPYI